MSFDVMSINVDTAQYVTTFALPLLILVLIRNPCLSFQVVFWSGSLGDMHSRLVRVFP